MKYTLEANECFDLADWLDNDPKQFVTFHKLRCWMKGRKKYGILEREFTLAEQVLRLRKGEIKKFVSKLDAHSPAKFKNGCLVIPEVLKQFKELASRSKYFQFLDLTTSENDKVNTDDGVIYDHVYDQVQVHDQDQDSEAKSVEPTTKPGNSTEVDEETDPPGYIRPGPFKILRFDEITWEQMRCTEDPEALAKQIEITEADIQTLKNVDDALYRRKCLAALEGKAYLMKWAKTAALVQLNDEKASKNRLQKSQPKQETAIPIPKPTLLKPLINTPRTKEEKEAHDKLLAEKFPNLKRSESRETQPTLNVGVA